MRFGLQVLTLSTILFGTYGIALNDAHPPSARDSTTTPLILEKSEGEHRVRKPRAIPIPTGPFTMKVDRKNGGSHKMWLGTEEIPPGGMIPRHKHLGQDEMLLIQTGSAHVWLGTQERDVHAGAIVFIPADTWVSLTNTGNENINLAFVFSDPGFDEFMRCTSVPLGDPSSEKVSRRTERLPAQRTGGVQRIRCSRLTMTSPVGLWTADGASHAHRDFLGLHDG